MSRPPRKCPHAQTQTAPGYFLNVKNATWTVKLRKVITIVTHMHNEQKESSVLPFVRRSYICMSTSMTSTDRSLIFSNNLPHCIRLMFCIHITEQNKNFSIKHELKHCIFNSIIYFHLYFKPTVFNLFLFFATSHHLYPRAKNARAFTLRFIACLFFSLFFSMKNG